MLCFMYVSRHFRALICEHTEQYLATQYFKDFEARLTVAICGHVVPKKPRRRKEVTHTSNVIQACDTPVDIAIDERILFRRIQNELP